MNINIKSRLALPIIAFAGIVLVALIMVLQPAMEHNSTARPVVPVNVITIGEHQLRSTITGFGTVKPSLTLSAKSEVSGRITYRHPELKKGAILLKDTVVIRIDDKDYQLALRQAQADLLSTHASLKEMQLKIENTQLDLKLANEKLAVRQKELTRLEKLSASGAVSQSMLDAERQNRLQQQQEVQQLENQQTTLPSEVEVLNAKIDIAQAKVEQSQRDLDRTEVRLPFTARVRQVSAEQDQFVAKGTNLFDLSGIDKVEINAQFPLSQFRQIAANFDKEKLTLSNLTSTTEGHNFFSSLGLSATVNIAGSDISSWAATVERLSDDLDPQSRTVGVVVSVTGNYENIDPSARPPLLEGNYMQVLLRGAASQYFAIPRFAVHEQHVYRVDDDNKLERLELVEPQYLGELALVKTGLQEGDQLIVSDVFPAVNGMNLDPIVDTAIQQQVDQWLRSAQ